MDGDANTKSDTAGAQAIAAARYGAVASIVVGYLDYHARRGVKAEMLTSANLLKLTADVHNRLKSLD